MQVIFLLILELVLPGRESNRLINVWNFVWSFLFDVIMWEKVDFFLKDFCGEILDTTVNLEMKQISARSYCSYPCQGFFP